MSITNECKEEDMLRCSYPHCECMPMTNKREEAGSSDVKVVATKGQLEKALASTSINANWIITRLAHIKVEEYKEAHKN